MRRCLICHSQEQLAFTKHGYSIAHCPQCHLFRTILTTPYSRMVKHYYNRGYFTGSKHRAGYADYEADHYVVRRNAQMFLDILKPHRQHGKLLDIGCATGIFLQEAQKRGYHGFGLDVSPFAIAYARQRLPGRVKQTTLARNGFSPYSFDIITFLDVFEHLDQPRKQLRLCRQLLRKKGLILINTGDTQSLMAQVEGPRWHYFIPPQHVYFYSRHNLATLLESEGFKVVTCHTTGKHLSLRYLLNLMRTINKSPVASWFYLLVQDNFLGKIPLYLNLRDNMTLVAQKK